MSYLTPASAAAAEMDAVCFEEPSHMVSDYAALLRRQTVQRQRMSMQSWFYYAVIGLAFLVTGAAAYLFMARAFSEPVEPVVAFWFGLMIGTGVVPLVRAWVYPELLGQSSFSQEKHSRANMDKAAQSLKRVQQSLREQESM